MKLCFNEATTLENSTLEQDLKLCEKHGYNLIEIRVDKLNEYLETNTVDDLVTFFDTHQLKPFAFNALEFITFRDEEGYQEIKETLHFLGDVGQKIGCKKVVAVPTFDIGEKTRDEIKAASVEALTELGTIADQYDMAIAFEFVGYPNCSVNTFEDAYAIVEAVDMDNVGIVLDCFHFHAMNSTFEVLENADAEKISIFHIDDSENLPVGVLRDHNRLWPGKGVIDLDRILKTLKAIGYDEMVSIELFRPDYWKLTPEETIKQGKETTIDVVSKYFNIN